ncbi:ArgE/DapE family deacylase [Chloroflexota bacterium]
MKNLSQTEKKIHQTIDRKSEEISRTLSQLVRIPTVIGREGRGQKFMERLYSGLGGKVIVFEADCDKVSKHKAFNDSDYGFKHRPNVLAMVEGDPSARSLILNGHMDVVPPDPVEAWEFPPWSGKIMGNRLYGRGAFDMKCGLVANYFALKSILESGVKPGGTVILESVIEEESQGGGGTLACCIEGYLADATIVTEPTGGHICIATPGSHWFRVRLVGRPAHAGQAETGINAISKMNKIYDALVALDRRRAREIHDPLFEKFASRSCNLNIGRYRAGDWPATVAGWAELECRIGNIPAERTEDVKKEVEETIGDVVRGDEWLREHPAVVEWFGLQADAWQQDPNDPLVAQLKSCAERVLGQTVELYGIHGAADPRYLEYFERPAVCFGPSGGNAHSVDEYVGLDSVIACTKTLASFILEWCGTR